MVRQIRRDAASAVSRHRQSSGANLTTAQIHKRRTDLRPGPANSRGLQGGDAELLESLEQRIHDAGAERRIVQCTIKVRFSGFETTTAGKIRGSTGTGDLRRSAAVRLAREANGRCRLLGLGVRLAHPAVDRQLGLFDGVSEAN